MFQFSNNSNQHMQGVHTALQQLMIFSIANSPIDFGIPSNGGMRTYEEQNFLFLEGNSLCDGQRLISPHQEGRAIDIFPWVNGKVDYDFAYCYLIAGHILGTAKRLHIPIVWGGDWDGDRDISDQTFNDLVHFELPKSFFESTQLTA